MIDRLFTAVLAFTLLAGGTAAVGSAFFGSPEPAAAAVAARRLPTVQVDVRHVAADEAAAATTRTQ